MPISREEVRRVALLARLALTGEEEDALVQQLGHILDHFRALNDLDTDHVSPTAHVTAVEAAFRDDAVENEPAVDRWLANAPTRDERFFKVPKIIE